MQPPDGELFHLRGEFREIDAPRRLAYTFIWEEPDPDDVETTVVLSLFDLGGETRLSLQQGDFVTDERRALHEGGWSDSLEKLDVADPLVAGPPRADLTVEPTRALQPLPTSQTESSPEAASPRLPQRG